MAKLTKKAIYASYGIVYENGKILAPEFGFIPPLLIDGNAKLGKGVWTFSTLPANFIHHIVINGMSYDIKGTCPCNCAGCYAQTGFYAFESTKRALAIRTYLARNYLDWTRRAIIAQIVAENIKLFRIHAAGDFFSTEYIAMWREIVKACPGTAFWTYTKNADAETAFDDLFNINIVHSIIHGYGFNFGHCGYILRVFKALKDAGKDVYICRCGVDKNQHCTNCKGCSKNAYVLFIEHSTSYKAENDPLYPELVKLIESQAAQA